MILMFKCKYLTFNSLRGEIGNAEVKENKDMV